MTTPVTIFIALILVIVAIIGGAWLFRRFGGGGVGASANRGRLPRLAIIDATDVMDRRKLVLVRRDNIEHLLLIGGPTDIVVEQNIVRATPQRDPAAQRTPSDAPGRATIPDLGNWNDDSAGRADSLEPYDTAPPVPEPPPLRAPRAPLSDEGRRPPLSPFPERRPDPLAGFAPESPLRPDLSRGDLGRGDLGRGDLNRPEPPRMEPPRMEPPRMDTARMEAPLRPEPARPAAATRPASRPMDPPTPRPPRLPERSAAPVPPVPSQDAASAADQNLAEMAQRLEAALRRPGSDNSDAGAPPVAPEAPARAPRGPSADNPETGKRAFENLEDEMASLLGRPKPPA